MESRCQRRNKATAEWNKRANMKLTDKRDAYLGEEERE